jgi:hypothetical protein
LISPFRISLRQQRTFCGSAAASSVRVILGSTKVGVRRTGKGGRLPRHQQACPKAGRRDLFPMIEGGNIAIAPLGLSFLRTIDNSKPSCFQLPHFVERFLTDKMAPETDVPRALFVHCSSSDFYVASIHGVYVDIPVARPGAQMSPTPRRGCPAVAVASADKAALNQSHESRREGRARAASAK